MRTALRAIVEEAYAIFAKYELATRLTVCNCGVCMDLETERMLSRTPLREVSSPLLAEYTNSAHGYDESSIAAQLKHFLPRYFELIVEHDPPDHMGLDQCLRRLGEASYRTRWPSEEAEVIDRFFDAFLVDSTALMEVEQWPAGWLPVFDMLDVLTMALTAGAEAERLIQAFESAPDPGAAVHLASLRRRIRQTLHGHVLQSAYLEDERYEAAVKRLGAWLAGPAVSARIEAAFFLVDDPRLQEILSDGSW